VSPREAVATRSRRFDWRSVRGCRLRLAQKLSPDSSGSIATSSAASRHRSAGFRRRPSSSKMRTSVRLRPSSASISSRAALALAGWSITSVTPAPEVTVNFMARSRVHLDIVGGHRMLQRKPRAEGSFDAGRSSMRLRENKRPEHKFERTARRPSIDTKVEAGERAVSSRPRPPSAWSLRARHSRSSVVGSRRCYRCRS
jgi:hypothetical protein